MVHGVDVTMETLPNQALAAVQNGGVIWTRRELLSFPDLVPGEYSLPYFLHNSEFDAILLTDLQGNVLQYCEDQLYEASDHRLIWVTPTRHGWGEETNGEWESGPWCNSIYLYSGATCLTETACPESQPSGASDVFLFADYFNESTESAHPAWERVLRPGENLDMSSDYVWVGPLPESQVDTFAGSELSSIAPNLQGSHALRIDPGMGRVALHHATTDGLVNRARGCLHLRAHFFDAFQDKRFKFAPGHWVGIRCQYGSAAMGLGGGYEDSYACLAGSCPNGADSSEVPWTETKTARSEGWHVFEVLIESDTVSFVIDREVVGTYCSEGSCDAEEVWLVGKRGGVGHWAAVELLHTPPSLCYRGQHDVVAGGRHPWQLEVSERGRWQLQQGVMQGNVEPEIALPAPPAPVSHELTPPPTRQTTAGAFIIECWSLPGESDLARIDRVTAVFVEQLIAAGVIIPDNFQRVGRCGARNDPQPCYIYRFGARRLHVSIREAEEGRLCLVVRCGGGFIDFAEFARKNGRMEQLKLTKVHRSSANGREVLQLTSFYSKGERRVVNRPGGTSPRPSSQRASRPLR